MDRKSLLAFILIFIIIILMPYYYQFISKTPQLPIDTTYTEPAVPGIPEETKGQAQVIEEIKPAKRPKIEESLKYEPASEVYSIETELYKVDISSQGGGTIKSLWLKNYEMRKDGGTSLVNLINNDKKPPLLIKFISIDGDSIEVNQNLSLSYTNHDPIEKNYYRISGDDSLVFNFILNSKNGVAISKRFIFYGNSYTIDLEIDLSGIRENLATNYYELSWDGGLSTTEPDIKDDSYYSKSFAYLGGEMERLDVKPGKVRDSKFMGATNWTSIRTKYFTTAFIPKKPALGYRISGTSERVNGNEFIKIFSMSLYLPVDSPTRLSLFVGPLDYNIVNKLGIGLEKTMSLGWVIIRPISIGFLWLFTNLHKVIPNYGVVLIIFSTLIKILLTPLTNISTRSFKEMQNLQPQMMALREKYKNDQQRMNAEMMKLYKEHNINPMGGCLPLLLQMPILFALFTIFRSMIQLRHAPFMLWINDLSAPDSILTLPFAIPIYGRNVNILPFLMLISQFIQQKMTTVSTDPQQKMTMYIMPIFLFFIFNRFPSGLNLYYTLFNILSVVQQKYFPPKEKPKKAKRAATKPVKLSYFRRK